MRSLDPQIIRIVGNVVQTSHGASVPVASAKALLRSIEKGEAVTGDTVGPYSFGRYNAETGIVQIGCHRIALTEARAVLTAAPALTLVQDGVA